MTDKTPLLFVSKDGFPCFPRDNKRGNWIPACAGRTGKKEIGNEK